MQRRVVVESLSVRVGAGAQQFTNDADATVITGFVQRRPACITITTIIIIIIIADADCSPRHLAPFYRVETLPPPKKTGLFVYQTIYVQNEFVSFCILTKCNAL